MTARAARRTGWLIVLAVAAPATVAGTPAHAATAPDFGSLSTAAASRPDGSARALSSLSKPQRSLLALVQRARVAAVSRPCEAVRLLRTARGRVASNAPGRLTALGRSVSPQLSSAALNAEVALLARPSTKACGGGAPAPVSGQPQVRVVASTRTRTRLRVRLPQATFDQRGTPTLKFPRLQMEGMNGAGVIGGPAVPTMPVVVAVPTGATVKVTSKAKGFTLKGVAPLPHQRPGPNVPRRPTDPFFKQPPFRVNQPAYARKTRTPASLVALRKISRKPLGLQLAVVRVSAAQSAPGAGGTLKIATDIQIDVVHATSGDGSYGSDGLDSPFAAQLRSMLKRRVVNWSQAAKILKNRPNVKPLCGEEMMVITSPALEAPAQRLATGRTLDGVISRVFVTGDGPGRIGTTPEAVQAAVLQEWEDDCAIDPTYILLLGDINNVPTFVIPAYAENNVHYESLLTDLLYAPAQEANDIVPLSAVGRLPVRTPEQADAVITKLQGYAKVPPDDAGFYSSASVAAYYQIEPPVNKQESRAYITSAEAVRKVLQTNGATVDRLYEAPADATPTYFQNFPDKLPGDLRKPGFTWDADNEDVADAWDAGRFAMFHLDHGDLDGWSAPLFGRADLDTLANGRLLPYIFSLNCLSGAYDDPLDLGFDGTAVIRPTGGAVGAFGPSVVTWGEMTETWQSILSTMYAAGTPLPTQGWVAATARSDTLAAGAATGLGELTDNGASFNFFGDPSLQFWTRGVPKRFAPDGVSFSITGAEVTINASDGDAAGSVITVLDTAGTAYGRAILAGPGSSKLQLAGTIPPSGLLVTRAKPGFVTNVILP